MIRQPSGHRLVAATGLHKGDRNYQQDQVEILPHPRTQGCVMGVVADGMGGKSGGRKAADQVIMTARQVFDRYVPDQDDPTLALRQLVQEAHLMIKLTAIAFEEEPHSTVAASDGFSWGQPGTIGPGAGLRCGRWTATGWRWPPS